MWELVRVAALVREIREGGDIFWEQETLIKSPPFACRLAEKYKELQATKEKIQKSIEVKKEHLTSLQPGLNAIMQVLQP